LGVQLFALTGVPPDRQVITAGTKKITDATDLTTVGLKDNQVILAAMPSLSGVSLLACQSFSNSTLIYPKLDFMLAVAYAPWNSRRSH
jgi:hypothetical protein